MKFEPLLKAAPFSGSRIKPFDGTRRYLSTGDLQEDSLSFVDVTFKDKPSRADITVRDGDVLFARMKGTKKVLRVTHELTGTIVSTGFAVLRPNEGCDPAYLTSYLSTDYFERQKEKYCSGAIQPAITNGGIGKLEIPLPSLNDQVRIAHLLGKVEKLIAQRKQHLQQLDELLKSVFLEMFGDPARNEKGWPINSLATYMSEQPNNGLYKPQSSYGSGTKIIRIDSFYDGIVQNIKGLKRVQITDAELLKFEVRSFDVLVNRVNSIEYLGKIGVVPAISEPMVYESNMMRFRLNHEAMLPEFLMHYWKTSYLKSQINSKAKKAVNQASVNQQDISGLLIHQPPINLQKKFSITVEKIECLKSSYQQSLTDLGTLYSALSQKAFKGELDLSRVPLPEVAA